jgi:hypothetical protein
MFVTVETVNRALQNTSKGKTYTTLKLQNNQWICILGDQRHLQGQRISISEPKPFGKDLWANLEKPSESEDLVNPPKTEKPVDPPPRKETEISDKTLQQSFVILDLIFLHVKNLEMDSQARAALVNNIMNLWAEGKIK